MTDDFTMPEPYWQPLTKRNAVGCQCGGRHGWTGVSDDGKWWVCPKCRQPSPMVIEKSEVLNLMRYGPHHNELVETTDLAGDIQYAWIAEYSWTMETIVGSVSGRTARVWVHKSAVPAAT